jgi:hypothetical protein
MSRDPISKKLFVFIGLAFAMSMVNAQNMELLVKHTSVANGADGVKRSTEFSERVIRTVDTVWVSRVLPVDTHSTHDHAKGGDQHKHLDVATATRWITKTAGGALKVQLVPNGEKVLVNVTKPDYGNIGFDGSWVAAWSLMDPASLKRMKAGPVKGELITYTLLEKDRSLKVVWNTKLQMPTQVVSFDQNSSRETLVKIVGAPTVLAWDNLKGFDTKDYSDYLD